MSEVKDKCVACERELSEHDLAYHDKWIRHRIGGKNKHVLFPEGQRVPADKICLRCNAGALICPECGQLAPFVITPGSGSFMMFKAICKCRDCGWNVPVECRDEAPPFDPMSVTVAGLETRKDPALFAINPHPDPFSEQAAKDRVEFWRNMKIPRKVDAKEEAKCDNPSCNKPLQAFDLTNQRRLRFLSNIDNDKFKLVPSGDLEGLKLCLGCNAGHTICRMCCEIIPFLIDPSSGSGSFATYKARLHCSKCGWEAPIECLEENPSDTELTAAIAEEKERKEFWRSMKVPWGPGPKEKSWSELLEAHDLAQMAEGVNDLQACEDAFKVFEAQTESLGNWSDGKKDKRALKAAEKGILLLDYEPGRFRPHQLEYGEPQENRHIYRRSRVPLSKSQVAAMNFEQNRREWAEERRKKPKPKSRRARRRLNRKLREILGQPDEPIRSRWDRLKRLDRPKRPSAQPQDGSSGNDGNEHRGLDRVQGDQGADARHRTPDHGSRQRGRPRSRP